MIKDYLDKGVELINEVKIPDSDDEFYKRMEEQDNKRKLIFKQFKGARMLPFGNDISFGFSDVLGQDLSYVSCYPKWATNDWQKGWNSNNKKITAIIDYPFDDIMEVEIPFSYDMMEVMNSYAEELKKVYDADKVGYVHGINELYFEGGELYITKDGKVYLNVNIGS
jgi:hypothetical protein